MVGDNVYSKEKNPKELTNLRSIKFANSCSAGDIYSQYI